MFHLSNALVVVQLLSQVWPLWPHGLQHARFPCPSLSPRVGSNSCPLSRWCHPTISSSVTPFLVLPSVFPSIRVFSSELALHIRRLKYWSLSFSISPSNEYSGLISFRLTGLIFLLCEGLWRVFSSTTVGKHRCLVLSLTCRHWDFISLL